MKVLQISFSDIYLVKMENNVEVPSKLYFYIKTVYRRFVDDIYRRPKLGDNVLFDRSNNYYLKIKLTMELNPSRFLGTKLTNIKFNVYWKNTKFPWTSKAQKSSTRCTVNADLYCSKMISWNFGEEISKINEKFMKSAFPLSFINCLDNNFQKGKEC